jgi:hypothetical protein
MKEETVSLRQKYQTILTHLAPAGAVGVSLALGAAAPAAASERPVGTQPSATEKEKVSERLAAVRDAVSTLDATIVDTAKSDGRLAWANVYIGPGGIGVGVPGFGGGWPNWNNWHNWQNWGNFFRNW